MMRQPPSSTLSSSSAASDVYKRQELLTVLIENPGFVFSRNELLKKVQGYDFDGYDRTIDSHIKNLRKKISDVYPGLGFIKSCLLYTSPSPRDRQKSRMPSSA
eukprot:TRINITY_DN10978_c0_g1_i2.p1 TRINITY_DN10978_c0_g1~~TRINITY_DN10978_c0_g1_i2.p1  ORF type:complete len:103 (+),score=26.61 TRINITY_DN10978_c0_g1_i2:75-383(+)